MVAAVRHIYFRNIEMHKNKHQGVVCSLQCYNGRRLSVVDGELKSQ